MTSIGLGMQEIVLIALLGLIVLPAFIAGIVVVVIVLRKKRQT